VAEVKRLLSDSRMVTLTGVGGVGKTRLAVRMAADLRRAFGDGIWLVELADLERPELLVTTLVEALEIRDKSSRPSLDVLIEYLQDKQTLVILDNCEHLLHECAVLAEALLRSAPELRILATSRQALGVTGEHTLPVTPLPLLHDMPRRFAKATQVNSDAVQLFVERAGTALPGFAVTEANRDVVESICRRLDGLPLGIELAVARLRSLSVEQLLDRLDDRFRLLTAGTRAVLPRQQTLRALIDWSHDLCTPQERLLWARSSVFSGGLDLEAAEAVCAGDGIARDEVIDLVIGLVDKSILIREEQATTVRYRLLETIRQYGRERLAESGQEAELRRRHRDYFQKLAAEARIHLFGPEQVAWLNRLRLEHANLRTALECCFEEAADARIGLGMAADLLYHWITSYYLREGRGWLDRGLAADTEPTEARARALWATGWLAIIQGEIEAARSLVEESRVVGERLGSDSVLGYVALYSGMIAMYEGEPKFAIDLYQEAVAKHRAMGDPAGQALAFIRLTLAYSFLGDSPQAIASGEEGVAVCEAHREGWHKSYAMMALGIEVWQQGDTRRAAELERESLRFNRLLDDPLGVGVNVEALAWIAATEGRHQQAAKLLGIAESVWQMLGSRLSGYGHLVQYHDECDELSRRKLGERPFLAAVASGARLAYDDALAYALGEQPSGSELEAETRPASPLTRREAEVADLVAQGMSNKEIAAKLMIAQRTAEGHLERILSKLGFNSRAQIAAWVEQNRDP
jgi:predicted ATPase/DNA-binding CsgD family transcriptional regulator